MLADTTVWAVACYAAGIAWNNYTGNYVVCGGWCGPINKEANCDMRNNTQVTTLEQLPAAGKAVVARAGPRWHGWRGKPGQLRHSM